MKTLLCLLFLTAAASADTLLDKPAVKVNSQVMTRGTLWNRDYREARKTNPGGGEAAWRASADAKEKVRGEAQGADLRNMQLRDAINRLRPLR